MAFATNALGHFQLTARLWEALKKSRNAGVVALSSRGHARGEVDFRDPNFDKMPYDKWAAYGQSKSANSLFAVELDKRGQEHGIRAFAVHPGGILTDLLRYMTDEELSANGISRENGVIKIPEATKGPEGFKTVVAAPCSIVLKRSGALVASRILMSTFSREMTYALHSSSVM